MTVTRKALGTLLREALEARGLPVLISHDDTGALRYTVDGYIMSPGETALYLGVEWGRYGKLTGQEHA